jgi:hypothetical protein
MNSKHSQPVPRVFIPSTAEDLRAYRQAAKEAAIDGDAAEDDGERRATKHGLHGDEPQ